MTQPQDPYGAQPGPDWTSPGSGQWNPPPLSKEAPGAGSYPGYPQDTTSYYPPAPPVNPAYAYTPAPPGYYADSASGLMLPDGTQLASVGRRIGGYLLDILLVIVTLIIGYIIWDLIVWGRGQTPAKQVLRMRCYRTADGRVAHWGWMALRQIIGGFVEGLVAGIVFLVSAIMMITSKDHRAIHDHIAGTVVLHDPNDVLKPR